MSDPGWDFDDRRGWRYSTGGRPVELALQLLRLLIAEEPIPEDTTPLSGLVTAASLSNWETTIGSEQERLVWRQRNLGLLQLVRHPAPDMAYVFALPVHPDQTETVVIEKTTKVTAFIFTLVYDHEIHDWKIHALGPPAPPAALGKTPFPRT
jgi:hypothetical protein